MNVVFYVNNDKFVSNKWIEQNQKSNAFTYYQLWLLLLRFEKINYTTSTIEFSSGWLPLAR